MELKAMMAELIERVAAELRAAGLDGDYCSVTLYPGDAIPVDFGPESGCGGTAWVRLVTANPTVSFPNADLSINNCAYSLAYVIEVGMAGPAPVMEDRLGNFVLPPDTEQFDASMRMVDEMQMMYRAIGAADIPQKLLGSWTPSGPAGGVMQSTWTLTIGGDGDD